MKMAPFEGRLELCLVTERARLGLVRHSADGVSVEVLLNVVRCHATLDPPDLRHIADIVERLGVIGVKLRAIEGGWTVGELRVTDEDTDHIVEKIKETLKSLDE